MFSKVLVPLDGSPLSETVLPWVRQLVAKLHSQVYLVRVVPPPRVVSGLGFEGYAPGPYPMVTPEERAEVAREAGRYLHRASGFLGPQADVHPLVREGAAAAEIVAAAKECGVEAIVMSTHGRTGLGRLVLGSVADQVVRTAGIPVLVLRPDEAALAAAPSAPHPGRRPLSL